MLERFLRPSAPERQWPLTQPRLSPRPPRWRSTKWTNPKAGSPVIIGRHRDERTAHRKIPRLKVSVLPLHGATIPKTESTQICRPPPSIAVGRQKVPRSTIVRLRPLARIPDPLVLRN